MLNTRKAILFAGLILSANNIQTGFAQQGEISEEERSAYERMVHDWNKTNYAGWQGIVFRCSPSEEQKEATQSICDRVETTVKFLAAASNTNLKVAKTYYDFRLGAGLGKMLALGVDINATNGSPTGMFARVEASAYYSSAVQSFAAKADVRNAPRKGDLIFFSRTPVGASTNNAEALISEMANAIDNALKDFFTGFILARRAREETR